MQIPKLEDFADKFALVREDAEHFNTQIEAANEFIEQFEDELVRTNVGVSAWVDTPIGLFGYCKDPRVKSKSPWRVMHKECVQDEAKPLLNATRRIRIESVQHLGALLDAIHERAQQMKLESREAGK